DPQLVFERLFADGSKGEIGASKAKRDQYKKSILDFVAEDAHSLKAKLGVTDQRKLDEYLVAVRELEQRLARVEPPVDVPPQAAEQKAAKPLSGIPKDYGEHIRLMGDVLALAFQADLTRIATFVFANDGSNRNYRLIDVPEGHHDLSHHGGNKEKH